MKVLLGRLPLWGLLIALQLLLLIPYYTTWPERFLQDEAYVVLGVRALLRAEFPYRDWYSYLSPGSYFQALPWMALVGTNQFGTRSLMALLAAAQGIAIWELAAPLKRGWRWFAWLLWSCLGLMEIPILNYHWFSNFWFTLATLAACSWVTGKERSGWLVGASVALAGWTLQSEGLAGVLLLIGCGLLFRPPAQLRAWLALLGTSLVLWAPCLPWLPQIWQQSVLALRAHQKWASFHYTWQELTPSWEAARASLPGADLAGWSYAWLLFGMRALKYGALPALILLGILQAWRSRNRHFQVLCLATVILAMANANRQTVHYFSYLLVLAFPLWAFQLSSLRWGKWPRNALMGLTLVFWALNAYLWQRDFRLPIPTAAGVYWSDSSYQQKLYSILGRWCQICSQDPRGALCQEYQPHLYSLWNLRVPIQEITLVPLQADPAAVERAARRLDELETPWMIYVPIHPAAIAEEHSQVSGEQYARAQQEVYQVLTQRYEVVERIDILQLLRRRKP